MRKIVMGALILAFCWLQGLGAWAEEPKVGIPAKIEPPAVAVATPTATPVVPVWKPNVIGQLNLTQNSFSNWTQGGTDSLSWQVNLLAGDNYTDADFIWVNSGKFAYGASKVGDQDSRKSADEIRLESVLTYNIPFVVKPYAAVRAESQFATGYKYDGNSATAISNFLDPGYFTESLGAGYGVGDWFKTRLGFAVKETLTHDYPVYADNPDTTEIEKIRVEPGLEFVTDCKLKLNEIVEYTTQLNLFSNLKASDQIVVRWDNLLSASVAKYVNVNFNLLLYYDKTTSTQRQINETLSVGLTYSFL
jgi:hypothetical protein